MAKDISAHIRELLFRHDCVILPGFGAFIGNYFPSRSDRKEGLFEPPSRKITFNRHLTGNDGLLIGHVSSVLDVGYGKAREIVNEWSGELRRKIMAGKPVTIDLLGTFSLNYEGVIVFEPDLTVNYLLSSYGLSAYYRQPVRGLDVRKKALEKRHEPAVSQPSMRSLLARAAVIGPILIALALVPFNDRIFKSNIEESNLNPLARAELEFNREQIDAERASSAAEYPLTERAGTEPVTTEKTVAEPVTKEKDVAGSVMADKDITAQVSAEWPDARHITDRQPAETTVTETRRAAEPEAVQPAAGRTMAVVVEEYRYMVILGSFQDEENALTLVEQLRREGYDPEMAGGPDGYLRVSAQAFPTLDEAKVLLTKMRREFPGAWVYKAGIRQ